MEIFERQPYHNTPLLSCKEEGCTVPKHWVASRALKSSPSANILACADAIHDHRGTDGITFLGMQDSVVAVLLARKITSKKKKKKKQ